MKIPLHIISLVFLIGCATQHAFDRQVFLQRPERQLKTYHPTFDPNVVNRVRPAPKEILQYLNKMDSTDKYSAYVPTSGELRLFSEYYALLPRKYQEIIGRNVVGIYFISNFAGGGMADFLFDENGKMYTALYFGSSWTRVGEFAGKVSDNANLSP